MRIIYPHGEVARLRGIRKLATLAPSCKVHAVRDARSKTAIPTERYKREIKIDYMVEASKFLRLPSKRAGAEAATALVYGRYQD